MAPKAVHPDELTTRYYDLIITLTQKLKGLETNLNTSLLSVARKMTISSLSTILQHDLQYGYGGRIDAIRMKEYAYLGGLKFYGLD